MNRYGDKLKQLGPPPKPRTTRLTDEEWRDIYDARQRGATWGQIHAIVADLYTTPASLCSCFNNWVRDFSKLDFEAQAPVITDAKRRALKKV